MRDVDNIKPVIPLAGQLVLTEHVFVHTADIVTGCPHNSMAPLLIKVVDCTKQLCDVVRPMEQRPVQVALVLEIICVQDRPCKVRCRPHAHNVSCIHNSLHGKLGTILVCDLTGLLNESFSLRPVGLISTTGKERAE